MFRDLPDRFPSVLSRDFRREQGQYEDPDNLFALYLLYNLGRYRVRIDEQTLRLELSSAKSAAAVCGGREAGGGSRDRRQRRLRPATRSSFRTGTRIGDEPGDGRRPALRPDPKARRPSETGAPVMRPLLEGVPQPDAELQPVATRGTRRSATSCSPRGRSGRR